MDIDWAIIAVMILFNGVFAAYEIALASITLSRLQMLAAEHRWGAKAALLMKESMEASLAVVQLGITLVGVIAAATGGAEAQEGLTPWLREYVSPPTAEFLALTIIVVPLTVITILIGELIPKVFALRNKELVCLRLSPVMYWFSMVVWPAVWLLEAAVIGAVAVGERFVFRSGSPASREEAAHLQELRATAALARSSRLIGARQERIILSAARLSSRPVGEIVLPAEHVSLFNIDDSLSDCLIAAHLDMHTRFPVTERHGDPQGIIGYVNFKDLVSQMRLAPQRPKLASILRPLPVFGAGVPIAHVLESMMREHTHIALVRDAEQRVLGIVTLEDIIEELVGEIEDEHDRLPTHVASSEAGWIVGGGVTLARLREVIGIDLEGDKPQESRLLSRTLAQWMEEELGRTVKGGDELKRAGLRILVRKIRRQEVQEAQLSRVE